jgi:phthiodiolone/phenolphthiodiolone dimycocerosates ketoreductase
MGILVGTSVNPIPPLQLSVGAGVAAEAGGYDSAWFPDHLMGWFASSLWTPAASSIVDLLPSPHLFLDPTILIALVGQATERMLLGTGVTDILRRTPADVARAFVTLSHATQGRAVLGIGAGERLNTEPYGIAYTHQVSKLEEALHIIRLLWGAAGPVSFEGRFWRLDRAVLSVDPYLGVDPPIWVGAHGPKMLSIAGRYGDGWLPAYPMTAAGYGQRLGVVRAAAASAGRDPAAITAGYHAYVVPAVDHTVAHRMLSAPLAGAMALAASSANWEASGRRHPLGDTFEGFRDYVPEWYSQEELAAAVGAYDLEVFHGLIAHGTAAEIAAHFEPFIDAGMEHLVVSNLAPLAGLEYMQPSSAVLKEAVRLLRS